MPAARIVGDRGERALDLVEQVEELPIRPDGEVARTGAGRDLERARSLERPAPAIEVVDHQLVCPEVGCEGALV